MMAVPNYNVIFEQIEGWKIRRVCKRGILSAADLESKGVSFRGSYDSQNADLVSLNRIWNVSGIVPSLYQFPACSSFPVALEEQVGELGSMDTVLGRLQGRIAIYRNTFLGNLAAIPAELVGDLAYHMRDKVLEQVIGDDNAFLQRLSTRAYQTALLVCRLAKKISLNPNKPFCEHTTRCVPASSIKTILLHEHYQPQFVNETFGGRLRFVGGRVHHIAFSYRDVADVVSCSRLLRPIALPDFQTALIAEYHRDFVPSNQQMGTHIIRLWG